MSTVPAIVVAPQHRRKIRLPEVLRRTGLSRSTLYELMAEKLFPEEAKAEGTRTAMWWEDEVDEWNESPQKRNSRENSTGSPTTDRQKKVSAGSGNSQRQPGIDGTSPQKQGSKKPSSGEMSGLEKTGMTLLGREVYRHISTNRLLLDVGSLLTDPPAQVNTAETTRIQ